MHNTDFTTRWTRHTLPVATGLWRLHLQPEILASLHNAQWQKLHYGPHSRIYRLGGSTPLVAKLIIPRSQPRDSIRKYGLCQAWREARSSEALTHIGLNAVPVLGWGMTPSPLATYESVLFMRPLTNVMSGLVFIRTEHDTQLRTRFLDKLAQQLARMLNHGFIHKDCHFDNVYITDNQSLVWIDNDLRQPRTSRGRREGLRKMLALLKTTARTDLRPDEWALLTRTLVSHLKQSSHGQGLVNEIS